jgi:hypothetical protein
LEEEKCGEARKGNERGIREAEERRGWGIKKHYGVVRSRTNKISCRTWSGGSCELLPGNTQPLLDASLRPDNVARQATQHRRYMAKYSTRSATANGVNLGGNCVPADISWFQLSPNCLFINMCVQRSGPRCADLIGCEMRGM